MFFMAVLDIQLVDSSFELVRRLTRSGQADIYLARAKNTGTPSAGNFVFKAYKDSPRAVQAMENEQAILDTLFHKGISGVPMPVRPLAYRDSQVGLPSKFLTWLNCFAGRPGKKYRTGMLYKFLEGGDLETLLGSENTQFDPGKVAEWLEKLCETLGKIHKLGIVHGDIKPGNLLWSEEHKVLWLIDFGSAMATGAGIQRSLTFTREYASPQLLAGQNPCPADDIYAVGVTLFVLLAGAKRYPVDVNWKQLGKDYADTAEQNRAGLAKLRAGLEILDVEAQFKRLKNFEGGQAALRERFAQVIQKCLKPNPEERYQRPGQILADLNPPEPTMTSPVGSTATAPLDAGEPVLLKLSPPAQEEPVATFPLLLPIPNQNRSLGKAGDEAASTRATVLRFGPRWAWLTIALTAITATVLVSNWGEVERLILRVNVARSTLPPPTIRPPVIPPPVTNVWPQPPPPSPTNPPVVPATHPALPAVQRKAPSVDPASNPAATQPTSSPAKFDPKGDRFINSLGMVFVPVQASTARIWFCTRPTSVADFKAFQRDTKLELRPQTLSVPAGVPDSPVRDVTWEQAKQFCQWLGNKEKDLGAQYRLPSDAEWSAAADNGQLHLGENVAEWCADVPPEANGPDRDQWRSIRGPIPESANKLGKDYRGRQKTFDPKDWLGFRCVAEAAPAGATVAANGNAGQK